MRWREWIPPRRLKTPNPVITSSTPKHIAWNNDAVEAIKRGDYGKAIKLTKRVLKDVIDDERAQNNLAVALAESGQWAAAIRAFNIVFLQQGFDGDLSFEWYTVARCWSGLEEHGKAIEASRNFFRIASTRHPFYWNAVFNSAFYWKALGRPEVALPLLHSMPRGSIDADAIISMVEALMLLDRKREAVGLLESVQGHKVWDTRMEGFLIEFKSADPRKGLRPRLGREWSPSEIARRMETLKVPGQTDETALELMTGIVNRRIPETGVRPGALRRGPSLWPGDSGWQILVGDETAADIDNEGNFALAHLSHIMEAYPELRKKLASPPGSVWIWDPRRKRYRHDAEK